MESLNISNNVGEDKTSKKSISNDTNLHIQLKDEKTNTGSLDDENLNTKDDTSNDENPNTESKEEKKIIISEPSLDPSISMSELSDVFHPLFDSSNIIFRKRYIGSLQERIRGNCHSIIIRIELLSKHFNPNKYGSVSKAKKAAYNWQMKMNDKLGKTIQTKELKSISAELCQLFAGFFDGDGCVNVSNTIECRVVQAALFGDTQLPISLRLFCHIFGGYIRRSYISSGKIPRVVYEWQITGWECLHFLKFVAPHLIVKAPQANAALALLEEAQKAAEGRPLPYYVSYNRKSFSQCRSTVKNEKKKYQNIPIDSLKLTIPYIAGLFGAEGCIGYYLCPDGCYSVRCSIVQSQCAALLHAIKEIIGGCVSVKSVNLTGSAAINLLKKIQPFLLEKRRQCELILMHWNKELTHKRMSSLNKKDRRRKREDNDNVVTTLKRMKRINHNIINTMTNTSYNYSYDKLTPEDV